MIDGHIHFHNQPYTLEVINNMVSQAILHNIDELYLLDHTHKFKEFQFLYEKLTDQESINFYTNKIDSQIPLQEYLDFIKLVKSNNYPIKLHFGLEVCYSKETEDELRKVLSNYHFDFLIGSVHFTSGIVIDCFPKMYERVNVDDIYKSYFISVIDSIKSKMFDFIGHPDLVKRFDIYPSYDLTPYYINLAKAFVEYNQETEDNTGLLRYGYSYGGLDPKLKEIFNEYHVKYHKSSDAHNYQDIGRAFDTI